MKNIKNHGEHVGLLWNPLEINGISLPQSLTQWTALDRFGPVFRGEGYKNGYKGYFPFPIPFESVCTGEWPLLGRG